MKTLECKAVDCMKIQNLEGQEVGTYDNQIFNVDFKPIVIKEVFEWQRNKNRQNTVGAKTRSKIAYSGKKLRPQKGSGRARVGDAGSPHRRKGGVCHGPGGKVYAYSIPKKKRLLAIQSLLSEIIRKDSLILVEDLVIKEIKTKKFLEITNNLKLDKRTLFIDFEDNKNLCLSLRNTINNFLNIKGINIQSILSHNYIVMSVNALKELEKRYEG